MEGQSCLGKEGLNQMRLPSKSGNSEVKLLVQFFQIAAHQVGHLHVLEMMPAAFIPRVEIRGIGRQGFQPDPAACAGDRLGDHCSAVDGRAIPDHQQPFPGHPQQVCQKLHTVQPIERLLPHQRVHLARGRHPAHDRQVVARDLPPYDRRLSLGGVRLDQARQQVLPRQPRSAQILTADSVQQQSIAAPEGSEINHGIHRNTRKRESESTSPFRALPGGNSRP